MSKIQYINNHVKYFIEIIISIYFEFIISIYFILNYIFNIQLNILNIYIIYSIEYIQYIELYIQ